MSFIEMVKLFENEYITILIDEKEKLLVYTINGYPKFSDIIRNGHDRIFEIVKENNNTKPIRNVIADLRLAKILLNPDIQFIAKTSYPRLAKAGIENLVILHSGDIHVKINVDKTIEALGPHIFTHVNVLSTIEEARDWFTNITTHK